MGFSWSALWLNIGALTTRDWWFLLTVKERQTQQPVMQTATRHTPPFYPPEACSYLNIESRLVADLSLKKKIRGGLIHIHIMNHLLLLETAFPPHLFGSIYIKSSMNMMFFKMMLSSSHFKNWILFSCCFTVLHVSELPKLRAITSELA